MKNNYAWAGLGVAVALLLIGVIYITTRGSQTPTTLDNSSGANTTASTTHTQDLGNGYVVTLPEGVEVKEVPANTTNIIKAPSLNGPIKIVPSSSAQADAILHQKIVDEIAYLKKTPQDAGAWIQLGIYRKMAQDYAGAAEAWSYVARAYPSTKGYIAYGDLGDLYMNFSVNFSKAEANYKEAVRLAPNFIEYYKSLFTMYTGLWKKDKVAAQAIIDLGLKNNPQNGDLLNLQKQLDTMAW